MENQSKSIVFRDFSIDLEGGREIPEDFGSQTMNRRSAELGRAGQDSKFLDSSSRAGSELAQSWDSAQNQPIQAAKKSNFWARRIGKNIFGGIHDFEAHDSKYARILCRSQFISSE